MFNFSYERYAKSRPELTEEATIRDYFIEVMPKSKHSLSHFVTSEDDLGPEIILNIKWIDQYRYDSRNVYLYLDLI